MIDVNFYFGKKCLNRVQAIKAIRAFTGLGLRESKEFFEDSEERITSVRCSVQNPDIAMQARNDFVATLKLIGVCEITDTNAYTEYRGQLQEMVTAATLKGDYYISKLIIEILEKI